MTSTSGMTLISARVVDTRRPRARWPPPDEDAGRTFGTGNLGYVKLRSAMFRNSSEKSSISDASAFVVLAKWL